LLLTEGAVSLVSPARLLTVKYDSVRFARKSTTAEGDMEPSKTSSSSMHFKTIVQANIPCGRSGKHKQIITIILKDLNHLKSGAALKIPFDNLVESKENVRSALNRATRKAGRKVATATDANFLYVWNLDN
jgi:hypothetical protein